MEDATGTSGSDSPPLHRECLCLPWSCSASQVQALGDPCQDAEPSAMPCVKQAAPFLQLLHGSEEPCISPAPQGQGGLQGLFPSAFPLGMELGGIRLLPAQPGGCSTQIVSASPSSDCSVERGEQWERWHLSLMPPPAAHHQPQSCSLSCLCCSGSGTWSLSRSQAVSP